MEKRTLSPWEEAVIKKLLSVDFPGRDALLRQFENIRTTVIDVNNSLKFEVLTPRKANVEYRVPVEAEVKDLDGISIHILLHVVDGLANELEVYKDNSTEILRKPNAEDLSILNYPVEG